MAYTKGMIGQLYIKFGAKPFTYKEAGIHFATLNAAAKRGYLDKITCGYQVTPKGLMFNQIEQTTEGYEYFTLLPQNGIGMMCSIKGADLLDAWDNPYNFSNAKKILLGQKIFNISEQIFGQNQENML